MQSVVSHMSRDDVCVYSIDSLYQLLLLYLHGLLNMIDDMCMSVHRITHECVCLLCVPINRNTPGCCRTDTISVSTVLRIVTTTRNPIERPTLEVTRAQEPSECAPVSLILRSPMTDSNHQGRSAIGIPSRITTAVADDVQPTWIAPIILQCPQAPSLRAVVIATPIVVVRKCIAIIPIV